MCFRRIPLILPLISSPLACNALLDIQPPEPKPRDGANPPIDAAVDAAAPADTGPEIDVGVRSDAADASASFDASTLADATEERSASNDAPAVDARGGGSMDGSLDAGIIGVITRVSVASDGTQADDNSYGVAVSGDGAMVVFGSSATNLVYLDFNGYGDIFLRRRAIGETTRVSVASDNSEANSDCDHPLISIDGTYIVFSSTATNLIGTANKGTQQIFGRLLATPLIDHRSRLADDWVWSPAVSGDGSVVAFDTATGAFTATDMNGDDDVYASYGGRGQVARISTGIGAESNGPSHYASVSSTGSVIAFSSLATNLVPNDTNGAEDVFVRGLLDTTMTRVSVSSAGAQADGASSGASISADGKRVAFCSQATNLVPGDTNKATDVFVHDLTTHETVRVSVSSTGAEGNGESCSPSLSGDGRLVAFSSGASNLVADDGAYPGDTNYDDIFVHDLVTGITVRVSAPVTDPRPRGPSDHPMISANGRAVVFLSDAPNLVPGDTNGRTDAFIFDFTNPPW